MGNVHFKGHRARLHREHLRRKRLPCHWCGQPIDYDAKPGEPRAFTVDHVIPQSMAPELTFDPRNQVPACWTCNAKKGVGSGERLRPPPRSRDW